MKVPWSSNICSSSTPYRCKIPNLTARNQWASTNQVAPHKRVSVAWLSPKSLTDLCSTNGPSKIKIWRWLHPKKTGDRFLLLCVPSSATKNSTRGYRSTRAKTVHFLSWPWSLKRKRRDRSFLKAMWHCKTASFKFEGARASLAFSQSTKYFQNWASEVSDRWSSHSTRTQRRGLQSR